MIIDSIDLRLIMKIKIYCKILIFERFILNIKHIFLDIQSIDIFFHVKYPLIIIHINKQMRKGLIFMIFLITLIIALTSAQQVCLK